MRKTFLLAITALVALMAASCQKEELGRVLTATIEQYEHNADSKAYINDDNYACWEAGDKVKINNVQCTIRFEEGSQGTANTAIIDGATLPSDQDLLAFYPASQVSSWNGDNVTITLPHIQNYEEHNGHQIINNPMAAYCPADSNKLKFRNLCALMKVTVQAPANTKVKAIQVKGIDNQMLCGTAPLKLNSQRQPVLGEISNGSNSVLLNFATPTEVADSKSFYIVVPGGTLFTNITIAVLTTDAAGTTYTSYCKTGFLGESLSRNHIGAINYTFQGDQDDTFSPDWMIRYTASAQVTPYNTSAFGDANFKNGNFSNNSGYLLFDRPLTTIGANAFQSCTALTTLSLPATLTSIGNNAFQSCTALTGIDLSHTEVTSIGSSTFQGCTALTGIDLSHTGVTSIGSSTFQGCTALTGIDLSHTGVTSIGDNAFESCTHLKSISLPATLNSLGNNAFQGCTALTGIDLSHTGVTSIGDNAFEDCRDLTTISLPATLTSIGSFTFQGCKALTNIDLSHTGVTSIGFSTFHNCESLSNISLPATLISIGDMTFNWCISLKSISLPATLNSLGNNAFQFCYTLTSIDLSHTGVTSIGNGTFFNCSALTGISLPANLQSIGGSAFERCYQLTRIDLTNTRVTSIGNGTFTDCSALTSISLPATLTWISKSAFKSCTRLGQVYCYATNPPELGSNVFDATINNAYLYVPSESVGTYGSNSNWSIYFNGNRIQPLP